MNKTKFMAYVASIALGVAVSFLPLRETCAWIEAHYWGLQLDAASDDGAQLIISKIAALDQAGIPILVKALGSDREYIAWQAKQELLQKLDKWRNLSAREYASRIEVLAQALADQFDHFHPAARSDAVDLATRILLRPVGGRGVDSYKLLTATEKVLRAGANTQEESIRLKIESIPLSIAAVKEEAQTADEPAKQPEILEKTQVLQPPGLLAQPSRASQITDRIESPEPERKSALKNQQATASNDVRSLSHVGPKANEGRTSFSLAGEDAIDLIRQLHDGNETKAADAEAELIRRGFSAAQLDLAKRLFDPDPAVRKQLVQQLPNLQGVAALPWLLRLCRDPDAEVRLAAIRILITSSDPLVLDQLEEMVQSDPDSAVRRLAERIRLQRKSLP